MFVVYELFKNDGKKFYHFAHEDKFVCEVYVCNHKYGTTALKRQDSELIIEEE